MIGKIYYSVFPFYDSQNRQNSFKHRPVLVIAGPRNNDYTALPVSSVSIRANVDPDYDIPVDPAQYPLLGLKKPCYIRTHKQTIVHQTSLARMLGDMKNDYEDLYLDVMAKLESFNAHVTDQALAQIFYCNQLWLYGGEAI